MKQTILKLAVVSAFALGSVTSAFAGTVGGSVDPINTISTSFPNTAIVASAGLSDRIIVTGTIDNNADTGWRVTVVSGNVGKLIRTEGGGGGGAGRELLYTSIKFVKTGGTLGVGLIDPDTQNKNIVTGANGGGVAGTTKFSTGGATLPAAATATTATVGYTYALKISASADTSLLAGTYSDTITVTIAVDA